MWKIVLSLLPVTAVALDLNPRPDFKELEGFRFPVTTFEDNGRKIFWTPPKGWGMSYANDVLTLIPKDRNFALVQLRAVPRAAGDREVLAKTDTLLAYCAKFFPPQAKELAYRGTDDGAWTIALSPAREYLFDFSDAGQPTRASVSMLDYSDRQRLVLVVMTRPADFDAVRKAAVRSMNSWEPAPLSK